MTAHFSPLPFVVKITMRQFLRRYSVRIVIAATLVALGGGLRVWIPYERELRICERIEAIKGIVEYERYRPDWPLTYFDVPLVVFDRIRLVNLRDKPVTEELLRDVGNLSNLEFLDLHNTATTDAGLKHLSQLKRLQVLRPPTQHGAQRQPKFVAHTDVDTWQGL